jgi:hypothetical protein
MVWNGTSVRRSLDLLAVVVVFVIAYKRVHSQSLSTIVLVDPDILQIYQSHKVARSLQYFCFDILWSY